MDQHKTAAKGHGAYRAPQLRVYGSVRNLTGGSLGARSDGAGVRTRRILVGPQGY